MCTVTVTDNQLMLQTEIRLQFLLILELHCVLRDVIVGPEPVLNYRYSSSGHYTFRLGVGVNITRVVRLTGLYSLDLTVLGGYSMSALHDTVVYSGFGIFC